MDANCLTKPKIKRVPYTRYYSSYGDYLSFGIEQADMQQVVSQFGRIIEVLQLLAVLEQGRPNVVRIERIVFADGRIQQRGAGRSATLVCNIVPGIMLGVQTPQ